MHHKVTKKFPSMQYINREMMLFPGLFRLKKLNQALLLLILSALVSGGCSRAERWQEDSGVVWSTTYRIVYRHETSLSDSIIATMTRVEQSLSPFCRTSRISAINANSDLLTDTLIDKVFARSCDVNRASGGMFDPTVGPLVELWGFGVNHDEGASPSQEQIDSALALVGIMQCSISPQGKMIKRTPGTMFNFSAITKGLGCDEVATTLRRQGVTDYMVEIGGEIALGGFNRNGEPWRIAVDLPSEADTGKRRSAATIAATDCGVATSGNYRNYHNTSAGRVGHTISPITGRPVARGILSATVIAPDCMTADALATACMTLEPDSAAAMIAAWPGAEALFILPGDTPSSPLRLHSSSGFPLQ